MTIDLSLAEHQQELQRAARGFFAEQCPASAVRDLESDPAGFEPGLWRQMAVRGWLGLTFPAGLGGGGGTFLDLLPLYEEMGRFLVPSPHLDTVVVAGDVVLQAGTDEQRRALVPEIAAGRCIVSLAATGEGGAFGPAGLGVRAARRGGDYVLDGTALLVAFAPSADRLLCAARTSGSPREARGVTLLLVENGTAGVSWNRLPNIAGAPLYEVSFEGAVVPADQVVGQPDEGWAALSAAATKGAVLQTASIIGAARAVLEMTNRYAQERVQFGTPIGRNQAVQYLVTDILIDLHGIDLLTRQAAYRIDAGLPYGRVATMAIVHGKKAAAHLHRQAHEVHAGIGFMAHHDLNLYSRRSKFWENNLGDARYYQEQLARELRL